MDDFCDLYTLWQFVFHSVGGLLFFGLYETVCRRWEVTSSFDLIAFTG